MANDYRVYINTLIFALVSCAVLLALLVSLMYVTALSTYSAFVITLSGGLLLVVVGAIIRIALYQRRMRILARTIRENVVVVQTCPDYYTATSNMDGTVHCDNLYLTGDKMAQISFPEGPPKIDLSKYDKMTMREVCTAVDPTDPTNVNYNIPWTSLRSTCVGHNMS